MTKYKTFYKRNLPHFQPLGYAFFVTFRLHGSLPNEIITKLKLEREMQLKYISGINSLRKKTEEYKIYQNNYFKQFDKLLDRSSI